MTPPIRSRVTEEDIEAGKYKHYFETKFVERPTKIQEHRRYEPKPKQLPSLDEHGLTQKERKIVDYVLEGKTTREIAELLDRSESVTNKYMVVIYAKLGVNSKLQLAVKILQRR
jgi:DNA-binding CsgD family transcriptional regulator